MTDAHLWYTDAGFVDVIHTGLLMDTLETYSHGYSCIFTTLSVQLSFLDAGRFGTGDYGLQKAIGHVDFYPANGNIQPYCQFKNFYKEVKRIKSLPIDEIIRSVFGMQSTCDHRMAKVYFIHSFLHPELYLGKSLPIFLAATFGCIWHN